MTVFLGGFKQFNSTLTKTIIQTESSSGHLKRLSVQSEKPEIDNEVQSVVKSIPINHGVSKNFGGGSVGCLKLTKDRPSDASLTSMRRSRFD